MTKKNQMMPVIICTAIFAVLSFSLMVVFKSNEAFFDTHGRIGTLAQSEQDNLRVEETKLISYKKNIDVSIQNEQEGRLFLPLTKAIEPDQVSVREEFANNKIVVTISDGESLVPGGTQVVTDSTIMNAVGIYKQESNLVLEIYQNNPYGYEINVSEQGLEVSFLDWRALYKWIAVLYIPFEQKDRLYSEEWMESLKNTMGPDVKVFLASTMMDSYTQQQVVDFANEISADVVLGISYEFTKEPEQLRIVYNPNYYIPELGSVELSVLARQQMEDKVKLYASAYVEATPDDTLIDQARVPATFVKCYIQTDKENIEAKYMRNHNVMEAMTSILKEAVPQLDGASTGK